MSTVASQRPPSPQLFFQTANAYQQTEAMKTAIDLEVFTAIGEGKTTAAELSKRCGTSERGMRILCDFLCIVGFITKQGQNYQLTQDTAVFLDKKSPAYLGGAVEFMASPLLTENFRNLTEAVRKGGTTSPEGGTVAPENPIWVKFARSMAPMIALPAQLLAKLVDQDGNRPLRVLDIAAGHGLFGIAFATQNPGAHITALDWAQVLEVAKENAAKVGVSDRYETKPGSAFEVDFGSGYDVVLLTNFLHHFDPETCEALYRKVYASLNEGGRAVTLEFVPNEDRITPPEAAGFSMMMLGSTPSGDAYTFAELQEMAAHAGFARSEFHPLPPAIQSVVISYK